MLSYFSHVTISEPGILEVQVRLRMLAWFFFAAALSSLFHAGGGGGGGGGGGFQDERVGRVRNVSRRPHTTRPRSATSSDGQTDTFPPRQIDGINQISEFMHCSIDGDSREKKSYCMNKSRKRLSGQWSDTANSDRSLMRRLGSPQAINPLKCRPLNFVILLL